MAGIDHHDASTTSPPARRISLLQVGLLVILLLVSAAFILPWLHRGRTLSRRTTCMSNLRSIGSAEIRYGGGFTTDESWFLVPHAAPTIAETGNVDYAPRKTGIYRWRETTLDDREISTTRNLYGLIQSKYMGGSPRMFICPESGDAVAEEDWQAFTDFRGIQNISYGQQVPYGKYGAPGHNRDQRLPLAADKGPYGAALESGEPSPLRPSVDIKAQATEWRRWNSPNHGGEGQNVLYADGYVLWSNKPIVGINRDNIYTRWSRADGGVDADPTQRTWGTPPTRNETPWSDTDALIYP